MLLGAELPVYDRVRWPILLDSSDALPINKKDESIGLARSTSSMRNQIVPLELVTVVDTEILMYFLNHLDLIRCSNVVRSDIHLSGPRLEIFLMCSRLRLRLGVMVTASAPAVIAGTP